MEMLSAEGRRSKFGRTSYDVGLVYKHPPSFNVELRKDIPLPPLLQRRSQASAAGPSSSLTTTTGTQHSGRPLAEWQTQAHYTKAPPHWNTHYVSELTKRLANCPSVRLLSAPISEARDNYRGLCGPKAPLLMENYDKLLRFGQDDQLLLSREPLISTSHAHHRHFKRSELFLPSALEVPPAFLSQVKSSGHAQAPARKASHTHDLSRCVPRLPRPLANLPFSGKSSEYRDMFSAMPHRHPVLPAWECANAGVDFAGALCGNGGAAPALAGARARFGTVKHILDVPKMYVAESKNYGSQKMTLI